MQKLFTAFMGLLLVFFANIVQAKPHILSQSKQLMVVTTSDWNANTGQMQRFERKNTKSPWIAVGDPLPVAVGKKGLAWSALGPEGSNGFVKKEGDRKTPAGIFTIGTAFGFGPGYIKNIKLPYQQLVQTSICVNDPTSKYYNHIVNTAKIKKPDWKDAETIRQMPEYMWGMVINYNTQKPVPGAGSCEFIHIWKQPTKAGRGGVALAENNVEELITWVNPAKKPVIVIMPRDQYSHWHRIWGLPKIS